MDIRDNSPLNVSDAPLAGTPQTPWYRKKITLFLSVGIAIAVVGLVGIYADQLTTKVAPGLRFRILGPSTLAAGQLATVTWDASTAGVKAYPFEKIEYCFGKIPRLKCVTLASVIPNSGKAIVKVPASLPVGRGYLKLTARDANKKLVTSLSSNSGTVSVRKSRVVATSSPNESSDDGSSNDGDNSNNNPSEPHAEFMEPLDGESITPGEQVDVRVKLTETDSMRLACQEWILDGVPVVASAWEGNQSPDLSAASCQ